MKFIYLFAFLATSLNAKAQSIEGNVALANGDAVSDITIKLHPSKAISKTDEAGNFRLQNVEPGRYTLTASGVGYQVIKKNILVLNNDSLIIKLELTHLFNELKEVSVEAHRNTARDEASNYTSRLSLKNLENPQFISLVPRQSLIEQGVTDLGGIIKNIPGIVKGWSSVSASYTSRGFNTRNYVRNGLSGFVTADLDIANIEAFEAVKGPSGSLFGSALVSFGGLLNRITKKPADSTKVEVGYQGGAYKLHRFTADINMPLTKDHSVLVRINVAQHHEGSFQDSGFIRSTFIAPSLFYKASPRLSFSLDAELFAREGTSLPQITPSGPGPNGKGAKNPSELPLAYRRSYSNNSITIKNPTQNFYSQVNYNLSDRWKSRTNLIRTRTQNTGNYLTFNLLKGDSSLVRNVTQYPTSSFTISQIQQNFIGDFRIGGWRNRLVAGVEFYRNTSSFSSNALNGRAGRKSFDTLDIKHPTVNYEMISPSSINSKLSGFTPSYMKSTSSTYSVYVSDVIDITSRLSTMLSLRFDYFKNEGNKNINTGVTSGAFNQTAFSPKLGLVYQIIKDRISFFGNYTNGFQNVAPTTQPDGTVSSFKPQYANQLEAGVKTELASDLLSATLSYYYIKVQNTLRSDPVRQNYILQEGTQYSEGMDIDLFSRPMTGLLLSAGFAYNNSKLTSADISVNNLRPVNAGPDRSLNFYASYRLGASKLRGVGLGFGGNYNSKNLIINSTNSGQFYLQSYTILNAGVFFERQHYRLGVNIDNLTNKEFYVGGFGTITPSPLRRINANFNFTF